MRLRLEVLRYQLPPTRILWQASEQQTIADLLHSLNPLVPLESQDWGLEDYVLETSDGFETLHYQTVGSILKEDDHVKIRPLSTNDIRARRITGRTQIHDSGARLLDGVVYGRPLLRRPARPAVYIASRERLGYGSARSSEPDALALHSSRDEDADFNHGDYEDNWEGEHFDDFGEEEEDNFLDGDDSGGDEYAYGEEPDGEDDEEEIPAGTIITVHGAKQNRRRSKRLAALQATSDASKALVLRESDDDRQVHWEDNDTEDGQLLSEEDTTSDSGTSSDSSSGSSSSASSSGVEGGSEAVALNNGPPTKRVKTSTWRQKTAAHPTVAPGAGRSRTRNRNQRRAMAKKLRYLKAQQRLPADADKSQMVQFLNQQQEQPQSAPTQSNIRRVNGKETVEVISSNAGSDELESESESASSSSETSSSSDESDSDSDSSDSSNASLPSVETSRQKFASPQLSKGEGICNKGSPDGDIMARREALLASIANGGIDVTRNGVSLAPARTLDKTLESVAIVGAAAPEAASPSNGAGLRKSKLNIDATQRLLLGSLGHRAPKTSSERATLVAKLDGLGKKEAIEPPKRSAEVFDAATTGDQKLSTDPEFWKTRIELTAVECCEDGIRLSTPPFPFYQRWDPSQQKKSRKRKRNHHSYEYEYANNGEESYMTNEGEESVFLNYDDPIEIDGQDQDGGDEFDGFQDDDANIEDDLPPVPEDLSTLPVALENEIKTGDVLVFKVLEVTQATKWEPTMSPLRTAKVLNETFVPGELLSLELARRDLPPKKYDDEGNRIYEKFETGIDEEIIDRSFGDLVEPRVLVKGS